MEPKSSTHSLPLKTPPPKENPALPSTVQSLYLRKNSKPSLLLRPVLKTMLPPETDPTAAPSQPFQKNLKLSLLMNHSKSNVRNMATTIPSNASLTDSLMNGTIQINHLQPYLMRSWWVGEFYNHALYIYLLIQWRKYFIVF